MDIQHTQLNTPFGTLLLGANQNGLIFVRFNHTKDSDTSLKQPESKKVRTILNATCEQLLDYFSGSRQQFNLPLSLQGTTFQKLVWTALLKIPYGTTTSYQKIATRIHKPKAARAVGAANSCNSLPIIIPCHRVIGSNGNLTGFNGGIGLKRTLLAIEGIHITS